MTDALVEMELTQGEDWTTDVIWTDSYDTGINVIHPCRLTVKAKDGSTLTTLDSNPSIPEGEIPGIAISSNIGLLQLHIQSSASAAFPPGTYSYDLFATTDDSNAYVGTQKIRLCSGPFIVNKRITSL